MKFVGLLFCLMLAVGGASWLVSRSDAGACDDQVLGELRSADGRFVAARFVHRCGGDAETVQVALRLAGAPFSTAPVDVVFVAAGRPQVTVSWSDPRTLVVESAAPAVLREEHGWRNVQVRVRRLR